jgi:L-fucose isomerase-like protein
MLKDIQPQGMLRPRLGVVVTTWSHENGHDYAKELVQLFPKTAPETLVEAIVCPTLLESENDIPKILAYFSDKQIDVNLLIPGNFTLDHVMPLYAQASGLPTILWGMTTRQAWGAFVGVQQTLFPFKELGLPYRFMVGDLGSDRIWTRLVAYARGAALKKRLKGLRVGLMGWRAEGMSDVTFDELALREKFGVQVVNIGLTRYARAVEAVPAAEVSSAWSTLTSQFDTSIITPDEVNQGVKTYLAMQQLATAENLQAVTVECFHDHVGGPCLGCSLFNDTGVAASCESDVPGALIMAVCQMLTGQPTFHVDAIKADLAENSAIWHHCGNMPTRLAAGDRPLPLRPTPAHIAPGAYGPAIQATLRPGPVTLVNLVGRHGTLRVAALEGEAVPYVLEFPGSAAKVVFPFSLAEAFEKLGNAGYGHHFALAQGHIGDDLTEWCQVSAVDFSLIR